MAHLPTPLFLNLDFASSSSFTQFIGFIVSCSILQDFDHNLENLITVSFRHTQSFFKMGQTWIDDSVDDSQAKWEKGAWQGQWHLLRAMNEAFCSLFHWEDLYGIVYTNIQGQGHGHKYGAASNAVINQCLIPLIKNNAQYLLLLYASCYCFCQAVTESYAKQVTLANGNTYQITFMASMKAHQ
ncbi:PREDICTED: uncharacterized protein LOC109357717 isoform X2 [Lupinus angustifolius]|uniref:uncharacterized protein LOC109357717 isoform X2 n=1 Tax=Lupinus angustifolius TaxID=3871 RepID=UPI00092F3E8D|nr:PREDICTED: uncharacterized protein LOC109357717 isoform X2 [Lupinus angustifolius]